MKKVIKRDESLVDYSEAKIVVAISKANAETNEMVSQDVVSIAEEITQILPKEIHVEEIQDRVEEKLMERGVKSLYYQHGTNAAQQFNQNRICVSCEA